MSVLLAMVDASMIALTMQEAMSVHVIMGTCLPITHIIVPVSQILIDIC